MTTKTALKIITPDYNAKWEALKEHYLSTIKERTARSYKTNQTIKKINAVACIIFFFILGFIVLGCIISPIRTWVSTFVDNHTGVLWIIVPVCVITTRIAVDSLLSLNKEQFKTLDHDYKEIIKLIEILNNTKLNTNEDFVNVEETWNTLWCKYFASPSIWSSSTAKIIMQPSLRRLFTFHDLEQYTVVSYSHSNDSIALDLADNNGNVKIGSRFSCDIRYNTNVDTDTLSMEGETFVLTKKYVTKNTKED